MLQAEIAKIPVLSNVGMALAEFAQTLIPNTQFSRDSQGRYVSRPHNFVTYRPSIRSGNTASGSPESTFEINLRNR